jgi:hypothetical protein
MTADLEKHLIKMERLKTHLQQVLQKTMNEYYRYQGSGGEQPLRDLRICIRPALLSPEERVAFEQVRPLDSTTHVSGTPTTPSLHMNGGDVIEAGQWEQDWAESERILTKDDINSWKRMFTG